MNRRDWLKNTIVGTAALTLGKGQLSTTTPPGSVEAFESASPQNIDDIHRLLGFATMTGEDPLTMWKRLRETREWLAGPLSPDAWAGQVFIADHSDIFAFRFLSIPAAWMAGSEPGKRAEFAATQFPKWFAHWPTRWWRFVGPRAPGDSYARLVWQMPDGGPEITYEWTRTDSREVVCRVQHSKEADIAARSPSPTAFNAPWEAPPRNTKKRLSLSIHAVWTDLDGQLMVTALGTS